MNCKNVHSSISAYIDGELSGQEMLMVRHHVGQCGDCAEELRCVETVKRMLGSTPVPEPSAGFEDRLVSSVLAATKSPAQQKRISILALAGIAAASMLGTMLLLNSIRREAPPITEQTNPMPYDFMKQDRAFNASVDPLGGSPVVYRP